MGGGDGSGLVAKSHPPLATPRIVACEAPLTMGCSRQEYGTGLPFPPPRSLLDPAIKALPALASGFFTTSRLGSPTMDLTEATVQQRSPPSPCRSILRMHLCCSQPLAGAHGQGRGLAGQQWRISVQGRWACQSVLLLAFRELRG